MSACCLFGKPLFRRLKKEAKRKRKADQEQAAIELDPVAYGYAADDNPDNPSNYHMPAEEEESEELVRGDQVASLDLRL